MLTCMPGEGLQQATQVFVVPLVEFMYLVFTRMLGESLP